MVRTYSNGSKVWFSAERQRFGLKLADQADGTDKFGQKLSEMVEPTSTKNEALDSSGAKFLSCLSQLAYPGK